MSAASTQGFTLAAAPPAERPWCDTASSPCTTSAAPGVYFARLTTPGGNARVRLVRIGG